MSSRPVSYSPSMKALVMALVACSFLSAVARAEQAVATASKGSAPTVTLVSAGTAPKRTLRFTPKKGLKKTLITTMTMGVEMKIGSSSPPAQTMPPIEMAFDLTVTDVAASGDIRYEFVLKRPRVVADKTTPKEVVEAMTGAVKTMTGLKGYAVISDRGFTKEADVEVPDEASPQTQQLVASLKQSMTQLTAPMPEEPVGVGAKWDTMTTIENSGFSLQQTATSELVALKGSKATLKVSVAQTAKPQKITASGMTADLEAYAASGAGTTQIDLVTLVPITAKMTLRSDLKMSAAGQKVGMKLALDMAMKSR